MVRNRYPLALIPPLAYLVGLIIIITVITRHKLVRSERRDSRLSLVASTSSTIGGARSIPLRFRLGDISARLALYPRRAKNYRVTSSIRTKTRGLNDWSYYYPPINDDDSFNRFLWNLNASALFFLSKIIICVQHTCRKDFWFLRSE